MRDIHLPPPIPVWPLAFGWYILFMLVLFLSLLLGYFLYKQWTKQAIKRFVLTRIDALETKQKECQNVSQELSTLLKRAALARYPRHQVAGLYAQAWLAFLDKTGETTEFSQGIGQLLTTCPYRSQNNTLPAPLFQLIKIWVKKNL